MTQILEQVTLTDLAVIAAELAHKSERFREVLAPAALMSLGLGDMQRLLRSVFATRRHARTMAAQIGNAAMGPLLQALLHGPEPVAERLESFCTATADLGWDRAHACDFATECLHCLDPERYWLWTRWMWDPAHDVGSLRLVTMDDFDLKAPTLGETYLRVGEAVAFVDSVGRAAGFQRIGQGLFGTDVYLAAVYATYIYTVLRMRMTREFNQVIPGLPEMTRRLLGVYKMEV